jgi:hypothetical protein
MWAIGALRRTIREENEPRRHVRTYRPETIERLELRALLADGISASPGPLITATAGVPISNAVFATFTVTDLSGRPGTDWRALINFGDGHRDDFVIPVEKGSEFEFVDSHTYQAPGSYTVTLMIALPGSMRPDDNTVQTPVTVNPSTQPPQGPHVSASGHKVSARANRLFHGAVATGRLQHLALAGTTATIDWGDESATTAGRIKTTGRGRFAVTGAHRYLAQGLYHITVTITDSAGQAVTVASLAQVRR